MTFDCSDESLEELYFRCLLKRFLPDIRQKYNSAVFDFAISHKLLSACVTTGLLDKRDCVDELNKQEKARLAAVEALYGIQREFSADGIRFAVLKGLAFEKVIYEGLPMRDVGDIDILVKSGNVPCAHKKLCKMGYKQQLGPSSGSVASLGRARFAVRISRQKYIASEEPIRRFPYKDAYCPYVKSGCPTVELHDGFRGLPGWYAHEAIERASGNRLSLVESRLDTLVFLLINTYENAESFYSNCFDDKMVLRDFVDLACYFNLVGDSFDWDAAGALIRELGIEAKAGRVLRDLDDLLPGETDGVLPHIHRLKSIWNANIIERIANVDVRRRGVLQVVRGNMKSLAWKSRVGLSEAGGGCLVSVPCGSQLLTYSLLASGEGVILRVGGVVGKRDGSCLVGADFFSVEGDDPPLRTSIAVLLEESSPVAFCREIDRIQDGFSTWALDGIRLLARYNDGGDIAIVIPHAIAGMLLRESETAISAGVYDRKYGNVFWARCRGKAMLAGDVPIGHLSLYCGPGVSSVAVEFSFARCAIASDDAGLLTSLLAVFERTCAGVPVDCDGKPVRGYAVMREVSGAYTVEADGMSIGRGLSREEASSLLMQDITDWAVSELIKESVLAHASSNLVGDGAVLCMGPSGSGKTSLALALAKSWPLRGDECSCVDLVSGVTWVEPFPVNVKAGNEFAMGLADGGEALPCESALHGRTLCFNRQIVRSDSSPSERVKLRAVIFPMHDEEAQGAEVGRPAHDALVPLILGSLLGEGRSSGLLREFMRMVSTYNIKLFSVRYSDAEAAARSLVELVEGCERSCCV